VHECSAKQKSSKKVKKKSVLHEKNELKGHGGSGMGNNFYLKTGHLFKKFPCFEDLLFPCNGFSGHGAP